MALLQHDIQLIQEVCQLLDKRFEMQIPISDLVAKFNISESTLMRNFKEIHHQTIYQYRLQKCMLYAKQKIENGSTVKEIVKELGYKTHSSFSRAFKKIFFEAPSKTVVDYIPKLQQKN